MKCTLCATKGKTGYLLEKHTDDDGFIHFRCTRCGNWSKYKSGAGE